MEIEFNIAQRLKDLRKLSKLTQEEFAEHADMNYRYYQHLESGRKKFLRIDTIERICRAYGIEVWEFFYTQLPQLRMNVNKNIKSNIHRRKAAE